MMGNLNRKDIVAWSVINVEANVVTRNSKNMPHFNSFIRIRNRPLSRHKGLNLKKGIMKVYYSQNSSTFCLLLLSIRRFKRNFI